VYDDVGEVLYRYLYPLGFTIVFAAVLYMHNGARWRCIAGIVLVDLQDRDSKLLSLDHHCQ